MTGHNAKETAKAIGELARDAAGMIDSLKCAHDARQAWFWMIDVDVSLRDLIESMAVLEKKESGPVEHCNAG